MCDVEKFKQQIACRPIFKMAKKRRSKVDVVFYTLKPANNAIAENSDEVIYPTPILAEILGVPFVVYP